MARKHIDGKDSGEITSLNAVKSAGKAVSSQEIRKIINSLGYNISYNEILNEFEVNDEQMTDAKEAEILLKTKEIGDAYKIKQIQNYNTIKLAINTFELHNKYNPLLDYFAMAHKKFIERAQADPHFSPISILRSAIKAKHPELALAHGIDWTHECLKHWLCGAIAKVDHGFQNWMLVLQGKQGIGKSLLARKLGRVAGERYFTAGYIDPSNKDHVLKRSSTFIWEAEELDATMNYADSSKLKAFITQDSCKERQPYATHARTYKSICSFIGTVNTARFLKDVTGSRRFLCLDVEDMDRDLILSIDMDMVWGEAVHILNTEFVSGYLDLTPELKEIQNSTNEESRVMTALEVALDARVTRSPGDAVTKDQLRSLLEALNLSQALYPVAEQYMATKGYVYKQYRVPNTPERKRGFVGCKLSL